MCSFNISGQVFIVLASGLHCLILVTWSAEQVLAGDDHQSWKERRAGFYSGPLSTEILQWAVNIDPDIWPKSTPEEVAQYLDMKNEGEISGSKNVFLFTHELHRKHARKRTLFHSEKHPNPLSDLWPSHLVDPSAWEELKQKALEKLNTHPQVSWFMQQVVRSRKSRSFVEMEFKDPAYMLQWHLVSRLRTLFQGVICCWAI